MRIGWIGVHAEGISALEAVCRADFDVVGLMTLPQPKAKRRCGSASYESLCDQFAIPVTEVDHVNSRDSLDVLRSWDCDLLVVLGWGQLLGPDALKMARIGVVGAHASLLPHNRGSAPVNWAIINGEHETGNSLIWLENEVDTGQLIDQRRFPISPYDTCATIYDRVAESNRAMVLNLLTQLELGKRPGQPQRHTDEPVLPRRRPGDGAINWNSPSENIYNLIRALARPYPGAFTDLNGTRYRIWAAAMLPLPGSVAEPGTILGSVPSPCHEACGILIATSDGALLLLELEDEHGNILSGPRLSDRSWTGQRLSQAA